MGGAQPPGPPGRGRPPAAAPRELSVGWSPRRGTSRDAAGPREQALAWMLLSEGSQHRVILDRPGLATEPKYASLREQSAARGGAETRGRDEQELGEAEATPRPHGDLGPSRLRDGSFGCQLHGPLPRGDRAAGLVAGPWGRPWGSGQGPACCRRKDTGDASPSDGETPAPTAGDGTGAAVGVRRGGWSTYSGGKAPGVAEALAPHAVSR